MVLRFRSFHKKARTPCVLFVSAKWCGHCRAAAGEIDAAQRILGDAIPVYVVDADRHADTVASLGVEGFPTILVVDRESRVREFDGPREGTAIASFARNV